MHETGEDGGAQVLRVLRSLGPVDMSDFDGRLRLQKLAYLIQEIGGGGGPFVYQWYVRGPYSPALTEELLSTSAVPDTALSDGEMNLAQQVRSLVGGKVDDPLEAELYASLWYLTPTRRLSEPDRESIRESMRRAKPHFTGDQVRKALDTIETFRAENGMVPQVGAV